MLKINIFKLVLGRHMGMTLHLYRALIRHGFQTLSLSFFLTKNMLMEEKHLGELVSLQLTSPAAAACETV